MTEAVLQSPKQWYLDACERAGFVCDAQQLKAISELETLWQQLMAFKTRRNQFLGRSLFSPEVPKGLYIWGGVGRGKTFLMDGFYACLPYRRKRRLHFHRFMHEVHQEMKLRSHTPDPLRALADSMAEATRLLCLDEFHVDDIADAMILGRLLEALFARGVVLLTTSNQAPDELYRNGLQRQNFLPAIALIKRELKVLHLDSPTDYRLLQMARDPLFLLTRHADTEAHMQSLFRRLTAGETGTERTVQAGHVMLPVRQLAREVIWFDFAELCGGNHDASDYLAIAERYPTVFLSGIPRFTPERAAEARRFTWLVDVLYDHHVKLVASFEVQPELLYGAGQHDGEVLRTLSRLSEMRTPRYLELAHSSRQVGLVGRGGA